MRCKEFFLCTPQVILIIAFTMPNITLANKGILDLQKQVGRCTVWRSWSRGYDRSKVSTNRTSSQTGRATKKMNLLPSGSWFVLVIFFCLPSTCSVPHCDTQLLRMLALTAASHKYLRLHISYFSLSFSWNHFQWQLFREST